MSMHSKFGVNHLWVTYRPAKDFDPHETDIAIRKSLRNLFLDGYDYFYNSYKICVPSGSDFLEIDSALNQEFKKHPALKGMRFQLQLCQNMIEV